jgi:hypothetical protein
MYWTKKRLLSHLPSVYRQRDAEIAARDGLSEGPLSSLLGVLAMQIGAVEDNVEQLYENWFIETCEPWVLPYIGDLLGINRLPSTSSAFLTPRAFIANAIEGRRRKGTPSMLEQLARDSTGWHAQVVEYFLHLAQTQHLNRERPAEWFAPDLRETNALKLLSGPFTSTNRLPEVRNIDGPYPGRFNIPNIGIHLWPLTAFAPPETARFAIEARRETDGSNTNWYLHPLGAPIPLFNRPLGSTAAARRNREREVPEPLRRLPLHLELEALRQSIADGAPPPPLSYFGNERPVLLLFADNDSTPIPAAEIRIVDFSQGWPAPAATQAYTPSAGGAPVNLPIRCAVDPVRGQIAFAPGGEPSRLRSVHAYGFTMKMGGGPYDRITEHRDHPTDVAYQVGVSHLIPPIANVIVGSLTEAVTTWNAQPAGTRGIICVMDNMSYAENLQIEIPEGSHLTLIAADWPEVETEPGVLERSPGSFSPDRLRPHLRGNIEIRGTAPTASANPGAFHLEGLLVDGAATVLPGHLQDLTIAHCTVSQPITIDADASGQNAELHIALRKSRFSRLQCNADLETVSVEDCIGGIPDQPATPALNAAAALLDLQRCTFWGAVTCREIEASDCIFMSGASAERTQTGCVRFSYLGPGSHVPRPFRCQPQLAGDDDRVRPLFESVDPTHPAYARLHRYSPDEIRHGGENRGEMGVFASLEEPLREDFLRAHLDDFLRAGLVAGIRYELPTPTTA